MDKDLLKVGGAWLQYHINAGHPCARYIQDRIADLEAQLDAMTAERDRLDRENTAFIAQIGELNQELLARQKYIDELEKGESDYEESLRDALGDDLLIQVVDGEIGFVPEDIVRGIDALKA